MAEPFKNLIGPDLVREAALHLRRAWPRFDGPRFTALALRGLDTLELKARVTHLSAALQATLPDDFDAACGVLERSLQPARSDTDLAALRTDEHGLAGWAVWPLTDFVARAGMNSPARALRALHALTQRHTAEFAIRPFLLEHPDVTFRTLQRWLTDASAHVRRLVSEGSRPRLPWGMQLKFLIADPTPTLPLLATLQDDASDYVRRSVANHLNDIAKDHPDVVAAWLEQHLGDASPQRRKLLKHASRTLIKRGHLRVLEAFGCGDAFAGAAALALTPTRIRIGEEVTLVVTLSSTSARAQSLVVDHAVHYVKANGETAAKVWKGWTLVLPPHAQRSLQKMLSLRSVTTRRYYPGEHRVELRINGRTVAKSAFLLHAARD